MINPSQPGPDDGGLEAAEHVERAAGQLPAFDDLPIDLDRVNQWLGLELHPQCQPLSPLLGVWRGEGEAEYPSLLGQFRYGQQITWGHDGREFLEYEARAWLLNASGQVLAPAAREVGWWRVQPDEGIEVVLAHAFGICEVYYGGPSSDCSWELSTDAVVRTDSARDTTEAARLYGILDDGDLAYVEERALRGLPMQPHLAAQLRRVAG
ncbi:MAG: FABP family protein [Pseudonocardia sp.]